jgi:hypothetical protein
MRKSSIRVRNYLFIRTLGAIQRGHVSPRCAAFIAAQRHVANTNAVQSTAHLLRVPGVVL